jgi:hypothetical protein
MSRMDTTLNIVNSDKSGIRNINGGRRSAKTMGPSFTVLSEVDWHKDQIIGAPVLFNISITFFAGSPDGAISFTCFI